MLWWKNHNGKVLATRFFKMWMIEKIVVLIRLLILTTSFHVVFYHHLPRKLLTSSDFRLLQDRFFSGFSHSQGPGRIWWNEEIVATCLCLPWGVMWEKWHQLVWFFTCHLSLNVRIEYTVPCVQKLSMWPSVQNHAPIFFNMVINTIPYLRREWPRISWVWCRRRLWISFGVATLWVGTSWSSNQKCTAQASGRGFKWSQRFFRFKKSPKKMFRILPRHSAELFDLKIGNINELNPWNPGTYSAGLYTRLLPWKEIGANYVFIKPCVEEFPQRVPGGLVLTDIFLYTDKLLGGRLFPTQPKELHAGKEAARVKKLMGALRYLYRNRH